MQATAVSARGPGELELLAAGRKREGRPIPFLRGGEGAEGAQGRFRAKRPASSAFQPGSLPAACPRREHPRPEMLSSFQGRRLARVTHTCGHRTETLFRLSAAEKWDGFPLLAGGLQEAGRTRLWGTPWNFGARQRDCPPAPLGRLAFSLRVSRGALWGRLGVGAWERRAAPQPGSGTLASFQSSRACGRGRALGVAPDSPAATQPCPPTPDSESRSALMKLGAIRSPSR